ncbi:MAG: hypothetical protein HQL29_03545 [Candidatus Omnitrophica bacterium]|nr:hypothetical protein [Candidatus Omnitrophota bacterium]
MDIEQLWEKAREKTEIIRGRIKGLSAFSATVVPYYFLAESSVNEGSTVIRKGKIIVEKPMIVLPQDSPQFDGFDFEEDLGLSQELVQTFFLMRGIRFPSLKYNNTVSELDISDDSLSQTIIKYKKKMEQQENTSTALVVGPEECWQLSMLIYVATLAGRCARTDIMSLLEKINGDD